MESASATIRSFNRYYTGRIGVLDDRYLGQRRPLAEARVLFEIGTDGCRLRDLRSRLALDSGYLARLLRSLERQGLVETRPDPQDRRARTVTVTEPGRLELEDLDARSDAAAADLVAPLEGAERDQLLAAMGTVHRLLRRSEITFHEADPASPEVRDCLMAYAAELDARFPEGFCASDLVRPEQVRSGGGVCVVARDRGLPVGCGVLHRLDAGVAEIKHLWVGTGARGLGVGRRLLGALEDAALRRGWQAVRLDTHEVLTEAINLYRTSGYADAPAYGANPHAHLWFEKRLPATVAEAEAARRSGG